MTYLEQYQPALALEMIALAVARDRGRAVMNYAVGHNVAGYLPEADVEVFSDFDSAKRYLISEMLYSAEYADTESIAEDLTNTAEDVNLWSGPNLVHICMIDSRHCIPTAWWITETDEMPEDES